MAFVLICANGRTVKLRVATYNVRKGIGLDWRRRPERILHVLEEIDADVVALQEADKRFGGRSALWALSRLKDAGWTTRQAVPQSRSIGWHGNIILCRPHIAIEALTPIELPAFEPRGALAVDLRVGEVSVRVVSLHLGLLRRNRVRQMATILEQLETETPAPTVLMGDTNEWKPLTDWLARLGDTHTLSPPRATFHTRRPVVAFDRIVVTKDIDFLACDVHASSLARAASDHLPLWADLFVGRPAC